MKLISIIIPSFNKDNFIQETLNSVKAQTFENWEAIVVDDGSTDNSVPLIKENCRTDDRIKLIKRKKLPKGGSACRNIGLFHAKGEFVMFLDADDILTPDCLSKRLENLKNNFDNRFWVFPIGTFYKEIGDSSSTWAPKGQKFLEKFLTHDLPWHTMSVVWRRSFLEELGGFNTDYPRLQDVELHTRALLKENLKFKIFPNEKSDAFYRIDEERIQNKKEEFYYNWVQGVLIYVGEIGQLIKNKENSQKLRKKLKGTVFSTFTTLLHRKTTVQIKNIKFNELKKKLLKNPDVKLLFTKRDFILISLYEAMYKTQFYKIKGFNFMFKRIFTY